MTPNNAALPSTVRARLHPSLLSRVTRMFNATPSDVFNEVFQNARRAQASRVDVVLRPATPDASTPANRVRTEVTVVDDGCGISQPQVVLTFGENGWDSDLVEREDAAGMGFAALAALGCTLRSWTADGPDWEVGLTPEAFAGSTDAAVDILYRPRPSPSGTSVTFTVETFRNALGVADAARTAAMYYPLPVYVTDHTAAENAVAQQAPARPFLDPDKPRFEWQGLTLSHRRSEHQSRSDRSDLNFFGLVLDAALPSVSDAHGRTYYAYAEVSHCQHLELVLPDRKDVVENAFLRDLRDQARTYLITQMAKDPDIEPSFRLYNEARALGIDLREPAPFLNPFHPENADSETDWDDAPGRAPVGPDAYIFEKGHLSPETDHALARLFERHGLQVFEPLAAYAGFAWYDAIPRITDAALHVTADGKRTPLRDYRPLTEPPDSPRVDAIDAALAVRFADGRTEARVYDTDLAFLDAGYFVNHGRVHELPVRTAALDVTADDLENLLFLAYFRFNDSGDGDSYDTQQSDYYEHAAEVAATALAEPAKARETRLRSAVFRHLLPILKTHEHPVSIRIDQRNVSVVFNDAAWESPRS